MVIHGLQKMTLLDFPGKVACTIFLGWCDFRCPFCHNWELIDGTAPAQLDDLQLLSFLKKRQGLLEGVAVTGGEPMLNRDLLQLLRDIRQLGYKTKVDTNGNHPEMLKKILDEGLADYIAMDVKNSRGKYGHTIGLESFDTANVEKSIDILINSGIDYEFRTTVVNELHDEDSFRGIGEMIQGAEKYFLQKFTDRDTVPFDGLTSPSDDEMRKYLDIIRPFVKSAQLRGVD
ncbi:MAG: anaerobic ribonucleoside-triphosphate reductase activating protein [Lachnospiraceae bacterium]|nr:anaerobic ribonucleoside-triphosphate reductase activating protein [Lachnospiraceae bacterium]